MAHRTSLPVAILLASAACGDDVPDAGGSDTEPATVGSTGTTGDGSPTGSTSPGEAATSGDDTSGATEGTETGFDPPVPMCGNGYVEEGEQCDDANRVDDDDCSNACLVPCGIDRTLLELAPTLDSIVDPVDVEPTPEGGTVALALLREITTDARGNQTIADDVARVLAWDAAGRLAWETTVQSDDGDVVPAGIAVEGSGDVFVAATADAVDGGRSIVVRRLAAADGAEVWTQTIDGDVPGGDDVASGIALAADGDLIVAGHVRVADGDNDVWVRRVSAADGSEIWTATHSGTPSGGFSTDSGGPVAVAADGEVYVLARIYVDFQTIEATLLRFDGEGGGVQWALPPDIAGAEQTWFALDVVAQDDGSIVYAFERSAGVGLDFRVRSVDADAQVLWELDRDAFVSQGADWQLAGLAAVGDDLVVAGSRTNDFTLGRTGFTDTWVVRLSGEGRERCRVEHEEPARGLLPPSVLSRSVSAAGDGSALVAAQWVSEGSAGIWAGWFRPG